MPAPLGADAPPGDGMLLPELPGLPPLGVDGLPPELPLPCDGELLPGLPLPCDCDGELLPELPPLGGGGMPPLGDGIPPPGGGGALEPPEGPSLQAVVTSRATALTTSGRSQTRRDALVGVGNFMVWASGRVVATMGGGLRRPISTSSDIRSPEFRGFSTQG